MIPRAPQPQLPRGVLPRARQRRWHVLRGHVPAVPGARPGGRHRAHSLTFLKHFSDAAQQAEAVPIENVPPVQLFLLLLAEGRGEGRRRRHLLHQPRGRGHDWGQACRD